MDFGVGQFFFSGLMFFNVALVIGSIVLGVYIAILLIKFLKKGTEAFELYISRKRD